MARPLRIEFPGACYHVINRGNYRRTLFEDEGAAEAFERTLGEAAERFGWEIHAYVIMRNHFHLAVRIGEPNLSLGMKWLQGTWIRRYDRFRGIIGRPFQGRYKPLLVEPGPAFGRVCHYIHLNPVRAGVVAADRAHAHGPGSLSKFARRRGRPAWLNPATVLTHAGGLPDTPAGWRQYAAYLEFMATDSAARRELAGERLSRGWCVGTKEFKHAMRRESLERGMNLDLERFGGLEPEMVRAERSAAWEERLQALAAAGGVKLEGLPELKSAPSKVLLAAAMKKSTSVSNAWLAQRLGMGQPSSASQFVRRSLLAPAGRTAVERLLSRVET